MVEAAMVTGTRVVVQMETATAVVMRAEAKVVAAVVATAASHTAAACRSPLP